MEAGWHAPLTAHRSCGNRGTNTAATRQRRAERVHDEHDHPVPRRVAARARSASGSVHTTNTLQTRHLPTVALAFAFVVAFARSVAPAVAPRVAFILLFDHDVDVTLYRGLCGRRGLRTGRPRWRSPQGRRRSESPSSFQRARSRRAAPSMPSEEGTTSPAGIRDAIGRRPVGHDAGVSRRTEAAPCHGHPMDRPTVRFDKASL